MRSLKDISPRGRTVFLRVDFNVPLKEGVIRDDTRIRASLPTLNHLLDQGARVILASHLGRPKGEFKPELSLQPVAARLGELISAPVSLAPDVIGAEVDRLKEALSPGEVLLLENVRFYKEEKTNDDNFSRELSKGIDIFVNDAFGACHRAHASVVGIPSHVSQCAVGYLVEKELHYLGKAVFSPEKPYVAILGGAKVADKIPVIRNLIKKADDILIGGAMAYTFWAAIGAGVGRSLVEEDKKQMVMEIMSAGEEQETDILLPSDNVCAPSIESPGEALEFAGYPIPSDLMALDIGARTVKDFSQIISRAKTILWNGPMGVFEVDRFSQGTIKIAEAVADSKALSIVGGGDSVAAVTKAGVADRITHISTGGGASLEYIANETLPGLEALKEQED